MIRKNVISSVTTAALLAGCGGGLSVDTDFNPEANFLSMETYAWAQRTPTGDDDSRENRTFGSAVARAVGLNVRYRPAQNRDCRNQS